MRRSKFLEEQVVYALRQVEAGTPVGDICPQLGVSEATFHVWKKKYAHVGVSELRRFRQLEEENERLIQGGYAQHAYEESGFPRNRSIRLILR